MRRRLPEELDPEPEELDPELDPEPEELDPEPVGSTALAPAVEVTSVVVVSESSALASLEVGSSLVSSWSLPLPMEPATPTVASWELSS